MSSYYWTGASDRFSVTIEGGHASKPHQTIDAIEVANRVINALYQLDDR